MRTFLDIPVGRQRLAACLDRPESEKTVGIVPAAAPVVVCCHGLTGTRMGACYRFVSLARELAAQDVACLRFDFRGCGESDGRFQYLTVQTLLEDLRAVIAAIDGLPGCDPTRLGLVGSSFGAFTAAQLAGEIDALRCLVFWAPVADVRDLVHHQMPEAAWKLLRSRGWIDHNGQPLAEAFFDHLPIAAGPQMLARGGRPLLIFHAQGDAQVPIEHGRAYESAMKKIGVEVRFETITADDHGMRSVEANRHIVAGSIAWLRRFLYSEPVVADSTS